jgi:hypothetical protein
MASEIKNWWELIKEPDNLKKWSKCIQNGPLFSENYKSLPVDIKIKYDGKYFNLDNKSIDNKFNMSEEEAIYLYARIYESDDFLISDNKKNKKYHIKKDIIFSNNFFSIRNHSLIHRMFFQHKFPHLMDN